MGKRIETAMQLRDLNQTELASLMGVTPQAVQQWVDGKTSPKGARLNKLSSVLGRSIEWLLSGNDRQAHIEGQLARPELIDHAKHNSPAESKIPPILTEQEWRAASPKTRALIEELIIKTNSNALQDDDIKLLQDMADKLSKK